MYHVISRSRSTSVLAAATVAYIVAVSVFSIGFLVQLTVAAPGADADDVSNCPTGE